MAVAASVATAQTSTQLFEKALNEFSQDRPDSAEPLLRQALKQSPQFFDARFLLGTVLASLEKPAEAITELQTAHRLKPSNIDCTKLLAAQYLQVNQPAPVVTLLRPLMTRQPDEELLLLMIEALHTRNSPGDSDEAFRLSGRGLQRYPQSAPMLTWRGYAHRERADLPQARVSLEAAMKIDPSNITTQIILADVARREGNFTQSLSLFDTVLGQQPSDVEALTGKSRTLSAMGQTTQAIAALQAAIMAAPTTPALHLEFSQLCQKSGDKECAATEAAEFRRLRQKESK